MNVETRLKIERRIAAKVIEEGLKAGFEISVHDGEGVPLRRSRDAKAIINAMFSTDDDRLYLYQTDGPSVRDGWVYFVYGNDGWDVICDYTTNLEAVLVEAYKLADQLERQYA